MKSGSTFTGTLLLLFLTACTTTTTITREEWDSRMGTYTYFDAVEELGHPSLTVTQSDGTVVADWLRLAGGAHSVRAFPYRTRYGLPTSPFNVHRTPDSYLCLTFDADEYLTGYKYISR